MDAGSSDSKLSEEANGAKRKRYVRQACNSCKKRKTKCSGDQPCSSCAAMDISCIYKMNEKKRKTSGPQPSRLPPERPNESPGETWKFDMLDRLTAISATLEQLKQTKADSPEAESYNDQRLDAAAHHLSEVPGPLVDASSIRPASDACQKDLGLESRHFEGGWTPHASDPMQWKYSSCEDVNKCYLEESAIWDTYIKSKELCSPQTLFKTYFECLDPSLPCVDKSTFERDLVNFTFPSSQKITIDRLHFMALTYLVISLVKVAEEHQRDGSPVPGWAEFSRADHLLNHMFRNDQTNLTTMQCLLLKSSYLLNAARPDWAQNETAIAVRLCFQLGLNDSKQWSIEDIEERRAKQQILWCVYCMDRHISDHCGVPYLIRDCDIAVDLPRLEEEDTGQVGNLARGSSTQNLLAMIKWARVYSVIWDSTLSANPSIGSAELLAIHDARIIHLRDGLHEHLCWDEERCKNAHEADYPGYLMRQALILFLRTNHLRVLLRRNEIFNRSIGPKAAEICARIASGSVEAIQTYRQSQLWHDADRCFTSGYLASSIAAFGSLIMSSPTSAAIQKQAGPTFKTAVELMRDISLGNLLGSYLIARLQPMLETVTQILHQPRPDPASNANGIARWTSIGSVDDSMNNLTDANSISMGFLDGSNLGFDFGLDDILQTTMQRKASSTAYGRNAIYSSLHMASPAFSGSGQNETPRLRPAVPNFGNDTNP